MKFAIIFYMLGMTLVSHAYDPDATALSHPGQIKNTWENAGIIASVDMKAVRSAQNVYWNYVMKLLNKVPIPDQVSHNGHMNSNVFYITEDTKDLRVRSKAGTTTLELSANDLGAGFTSSNFTYGLHYFSSFGLAEVKFSKVSLKIEFEIGSQQQNDLESFAIKVNSFDIDIPSENMDITIHGNYFTNLAGVFKGFFVSHLRDHIQNHLKDMIFRDLPYVFNRDARSKDTTTQISEDVILDWHLAGKPENQDEKFVFAIKGLSSVNETLMEAQMVPATTKQLPSQFNLDSKDDDYDFRAYIRKVGVKQDNTLVKKLLSESKHIDMFRTYRLSDLKLEEEADYFVISANVSSVMPLWAPQTLPHMSSKWSFWLEHLNSEGVHTRKMSKPIVYRWHQWLMQYYDKYGILKKIDKFYSPILYKIMGEKNPEEDN